MEMASASRADYARNELPDAGSAPSTPERIAMHQLLDSSVVAVHITPVSDGRSRRSLGRGRFAVALTVALATMASAPAEAQLAATANEGAPPAIPLMPAAPTRPLSAYVREVFQDRSGNYWFGTNDEGVARYDGSILVFLNTTHGLAGNAVRGIVQSADGAVWIATDGGVSRYLDGRFRNFTVADGLSDASIWSMVLDHTGTIWVGTHEGVCRLVGERFVAFPLPRVEVATPESRFSPKVVFAIGEDRAGHLWFGTDGEGVHRFDGKAFTSYSTKDGLGGMMVRAIHEDRRGRIWIGSDGGGVSCYDGTAFRTFTSRDGLSNDRVFEILEDRTGTLWLSTLGDGLSRYDGTRFLPIGKDNGLSFDEMPCACGSGRLTKECHGPRGVHVQDIFEDRDGTLWFGCSGGLFRRDGEAFVHVSRDGPWSRGTTASETASVPASLVPFATMIGGEWRVTFASGTTQFDRWRWGPGRHSVVAETYGPDAVGNPWRVWSVYYRQPGSNDVRLISLHPPAGALGRGVAEGTAAKVGDRMVARTTLRQSGRVEQPRQIETRWEFHGPDAYRAALVEDSGRGFEEFVAWEYTRSYELSALPPIAEGAERPSGALGFARDLVGRTWCGDAQRGDGASLQASVTFDWIPYLGVLRAQISFAEKDAVARRSMEVYLIPAAWSEAFRILVLSDSGGVFEGDATVAGNGREVAGVLNERTGETTVQRALRWTLEADGAPRVRFWSSVDMAGTPLLDLVLRR
jgi:streptogramin lyase